MNWLHWGCRQLVRLRSVILRLYNHHILPAIRQTVCFASWLKMCGDLFQSPCTTSNFHHGNDGESHWRCLFSLPRSFFSRDWLVEFCAGLINPLVSGHWRSLALLKGCGPSCLSGAVGCSWLWTFWRGNPGELWDVVCSNVPASYGMTMLLHLWTSVDLLDSTCRFNHSSQEIQILRCWWFQSSLTWMTENICWHPWFNFITTIFHIVFSSS